MQSALFHFDALLLVILLLICTCTYVRQTVPGMVDSRKDKNVSVLFFLSFSLPLLQLVHLTLFVYYSFFGMFWKFARIGERLSPYVSICCMIMAVSGLIPVLLSGWMDG